MLSLVAVVGCSGGDDTADDTTGSTVSADTTTTGSSTEDQSDDPADTTDLAADVVLPTLGELDDCGSDDRPCSWEDADEPVLDRSLEIGAAAIAGYIDGTELLQVAEQIADEADIAEVFLSDEAILYRLHGGLAMWVDGDDIGGTRGGPAAIPASASAPAPEATPAPRDVVGDDPEQKRALVLAPYQFEFGVSDESPEIAALYGAARGYEGNVDYFANTATDLGVGLDQFRDWDSYDVIHISTHGRQICDASGCQTLLYIGKEYQTKTILFGEGGGMTVSFTRTGRSVAASNLSLGAKYPNGLPDTVIVMSACQTGRGTELTSTFGDGVVFSWTEAVATDFARSSMLALHRALIETGATTARAHQVVTDAGLASYEAPIAATPSTPPGTTLVLGSDGKFHMVVGVGAGGSEANATGAGPVIENLGQPPATTPAATTLTVSMVRRTGGTGDLRVREVAWIDHPQEQRMMNDGDQVRVDLRADGDYLPVSLRVEGIDPGQEADTTLRLEIDGVEMKSWAASEGRATGRWGEWLIEDDVKLLQRVADDDEVDLRLLIDLPEGGKSEHSVDQIELVCLPGTWRLRSQEFLEGIVAASGGADLNMSYRSGEYRVVFRADGTATGYRDQWQFGAGTPQGVLVTTINSTDPATWTVSDGQLTLDDQGSTAEVTLQIEVNGQLRNFPVAGTQSIGTDAISGTGTFTCEDDVLTTMFQGVTATFDYIGPAT